MKRITIIAGTLLFFYGHMSGLSLIIIDTHGKDRHQFRNLELLCQSVGFKTDYKNIYDILEEPNFNHYFNHHDAALFLCSPELLSNPSHPIAQTCFDALRSFAQQPDKSVGFILPARPHYSAAMHQRVMNILSSLNLFSGNKALEAIANPFMAYFLQSDVQHADLFGSTLLNSKPNTFNIPQSNELAAAMNYAREENNLLALRSPINTQTLSPRAQQTLPLALFLADEKTHNIILLSKLSLVSFAELDENFIKNPYDLEIRQELLAAAQQTLLEFFQATRNHSLENIAGAHRPALPKELTLAYMQHKKEEARTHLHLDKRYDWTKHGITCAWLDPYDFNDQPTVLDRGIKMLYNAHFNLLWFELLPDWFLSDHGRKKEERESYIAHIKKLFAAFTIHARTHKKEMPKVFLGLNLTGNFFNHPVAHPVVDLFGKRYSKIPSPLDVDNFWKPEALDIFDTFLATFKEVPVDGVFFDFEMYHAQDQAGSFTELMDFSDFTWQRYVQKNKKAPHRASLEEKIDYLKTHKLFDDYFKTLSNNAADIGRMLKKHMRAQLPNTLFAAYAPTLPNSWFYRGITRGLSSKKEPLLFATFNTDYFSHHDWLQKQHIYLLHASVVMLSKLTSEKNFTIVDNVRKYHDFVWYNRPSRMVPLFTPEERNKQWWGIESSPLPTEEFAELVAEH